MSDHDLNVADEELLARLTRIAATVDPVPEYVVELGKAAFALRHADTALMTMVTEDLSEAAVRDSNGSGTASHLLVFEHGGVSIEVEVTRRGEFSRVIGVVTSTAAGPGPGAPGTEQPSAAGSVVSLETSASSTRVELDDGRFAFERVPLGLARLVLEHDGERVMSTPWFEAR